MSFLLAVVIGLLFAAGIYMILRRSFVKLIIGLGLLGHAANLSIITAGGVTYPRVGDEGEIIAARGAPPLIRASEKYLAEGAADPVPPALVLTAIVISFAIVSYTIILVKRTYQEVGTDDLDAMRTTDLPPEPIPAEDGPVAKAA